MTPPTLNISGPSNTADPGLSSARSAHAPRHRTTFPDWLGQLTETSAARARNPGGAGVADNMPGVGTLPDRASFRARGNTPPPIPKESIPGFERSRSRIAPHLIRYAEVPDVVKFPSGPYRQAPAQKGGEWWLVNPFTGPEPWLRLEQLPQAPQEDVLPEGFADIFGPQPTRKEHPDYFEFRLAKMEWEHDLEGFQQAGIPEGLDPMQLEAATAAFLEWGLGEPVFYEGSHGWRARFPDSAVKGFEVSPTTAVQAPHIVIAKYQIRMIQHGATPDIPHPWVPPHLLTPADA